jgi:hypothetical protein
MKRRVQGPGTKTFSTENFFTFTNDVAEASGMKRVPEEYTSLINDAISAKVLPKHHPHLKLIEDLKKVVKKKKADYLGIINPDLQHIINA